MSGYSKNLVTLEQMLPFLGPVIKGELCKWAVPAGEADKFAYKVREALYIARLHRELIQRWAREYAEGPFEADARQRYADMSNLSKLAERFRVVVISPTIVQTQLAKGRTEAEVLSGAAPANGYEDAGRSVVTVGRQTVKTIKQAWTASQPSNTPLHFPTAGLSYDELVELHAWVSSLQLLMFEVDGAITIQHTTRDLAEFAWAPRSSEPLDEPEIPFPFKD